MAPDAGALDVDVRVPLCQLAHPGDLIRDGVVAHVAVVEVGERLRSPLGAHAVDGDNDEPELGERLVIAARGNEEPGADAAAPRTRIDVVDDRILPRLV